MIKEYYLHLFGGVSGEMDMFTGAGRLITATLMSGYGLQATTKKDLQSRVGWEITPGCFLGQRELAPNNRRIEIKFANLLVQYRKVSRVMNYQLDWSVLNGEWDFHVTSAIWKPLAQIYWMGKFLFGRNVIPEDTLALLRQRFSPECSGSDNGTLKNYFIMQFMKDIGLPVSSIEEVNLFSESLDDLPRMLTFGSFIISMNETENSPGFFALSSIIPQIFQLGDPIQDSAPLFRTFAQGAVGSSIGRAIPLAQSYYSTYGMGRPGIPTNPNRMPSHAREIIPLLFCRTDVTPARESVYNYTLIRGERFNTEYLTNLYVYMTAALLWEYHLFMTGEELFPLSVLSEARATHEWTEEEILSRLVNLSPANTKNCSVTQIVRFNLLRQQQV